MQFGKTYALATDRCSSGAVGAIADSNLRNSMNPYSYSQLIFFGKKDFSCGLM